MASRQKLPSLPRPRTSGQDVNSASTDRGMIRLIPIPVLTSQSASAGEASIAKDVGQFKQKSDDREGENPHPQEIYSTEKARDEQIRSIHSWPGATEPGPRRVGRREGRARPEGLEAPGSDSRTGFRERAGHASYQIPSFEPLARDCDADVIGLGAER